MVCQKTFIVLKALKKVSVMEKCCQSFQNFKLSQNLQNFKVLQFQKIKSTISDISTYSNLNNLETKSSTSQSNCTPPASLYPLSQPHDTRQLIQLGQPVKIVQLNVLSLVICHRNVKNVSNNNKQSACGIVQSTMKFTSHVKKICVRGWRRPFLLHHATHHHELFIC